MADKYAVGTVGPGGAKWRSGAGGKNRFDWKAEGSGLWSQGIDPSDPKAAYSWYEGAKSATTPYQRGVNAGVSQYAAKNPSFNASDPAHVAKALDWYWRDNARKIQKENGFLDSTLGKIITAGAQVALTVATGGVGAATALGAVTGGITGGLKGAVIGAASGYGVGKGTQWVAGGGITRSFNTLLGKGAKSSIGTGVANTMSGGGDYIANLPTAGAAGVSKTGVAATATSLYDKGKSLLGKGAQIGNTAATAITAGVGLKQLLAPAAVGGAAYLAANTGAQNLNTNPAAPPAETKTEYELQVEKERRRRKMTNTDVTWGSALTAPTIKRPTLLGGAVRLAA